MELEQLNTDLGIYLCGGIEDYLEVLSVFKDSIDSKSEKIENSWKNEAYDTYTTLVHSLKSSARTIGATEISDLAKKLESAGKNGEIDIIEKETPMLLEMYRELKKHL